MDSTKYYFKYKSLKRKFDDFSDRMIYCNFGVNLGDDDYNTDGWCQNYAKRHCNNCNFGYCDDHLPGSCQECSELDEYCDSCHNYIYHPMNECSVCKTSRRKYIICENCGWMCCEFGRCSAKNICGRCFNECVMCRNTKFFSENVNDINILFYCQIKEIINEILIGKIDKYQISVINNYLTNN